MCIRDSSDCTLDPETKVIISYKPSGKSRAELDASNNQRLLALLEGIEGEQRNAYFVVHISVALPNAQIVFSQEFRFQGKIANEIRGVNGFGYDCVFEPNETPGKLASELSEDEKFAISHRGKAIKQLNKWLSCFSE